MILKKIHTFFTYSDSDSPAPDYGKILLLILIGWAVLWTLLPCIALSNDFIDVLENIVWGKHWDWGYDKNPYLGAWLGYSAWIFSGKSFFSSFLVSQIFVCIGIWSVWLIGKRILPARTAFLSAVSLLAINFYGIKAVELCDDVMELGLWPLTMLFVYLGVRGEEKKKPLFWLAAGFFAGASLMVKYFAPALFASLGIPLLFTKEGRKNFSKPCFYLALLSFIPLILPNLLWQFRHQGKTFDYVSVRAGLTASVPWMDHFLNPLSTINRAAGVIVVMLIFFWLVFLIPSRGKAREHFSPFDRIFVTSCCWGSFCSALLFSLVTGGSINYSWVVPCFPMIGLWLFMVWQPYISRMKTKIYTVLILLMGLLFGVIFTIRSLEHQGYRKRGCDYENYPGKQIAAAAERVWHIYRKEKIPFVAANRECACNAAVYSAEAPEAFFEADATQSQWIVPEKVQKKGCILIWEGKPENIPNPLQTFREQKFSKKQWTVPVCTELERAVPEWYRELRGPAPKHPFTFQVLLPEDGTQRTR